MYIDSLVAEAKHKRTKIKKKPKLCVELNRMKRVKKKLIGMGILTQYKYEHYGYTPYFLSYFPFEFLFPFPFGRGFYLREVKNNRIRKICINENINRSLALLLFVVSCVLFLCLWCWWYCRANASCAIHQNYKQQKSKKNVFPVFCRLRIWSFHIQRDTNTSTHLAMLHPWRKRLLYY